ncbi:MAG TPA: hypothetical protein QGF27_05915 [Arenicellales bacterium]|nr:hypothetical protein [Arenicellales bacterium]HJP09538.1 hypothetical protein [Arenicellales bacterium]
MKRIIVSAFLLLLPISASSVDFLNDISVTYGAFSIGYAQEDVAKGHDEISLGYNEWSVFHSNEAKIGIEYEFELPAGDLSAAVFLEHSDADENTMGASLSREFAQISLQPEVTWNIDTSEHTFEFGAGYTWEMSDTFSVTPNITIPFDNDWDRDEMIAGLSVSIKLGPDSGSK